MESKKINFKEFDYNLIASRDMISKLIDCQIRSYKQQILSEWERNHAAPSGSKQSKIKELEERKQELNQILREYNSQEALIDFSISIDINIKQEAGLVGQY